MIVKTVYLENTIFSNKVESSLIKPFYSRKDVLDLALDEILVELENFNLEKYFISYHEKEKEVLKLLEETKAKLCENLKSDLDIEESKRVQDFFTNFENQKIINPNEQFVKHLAKEFEAKNEGEVLAFSFSEKMSFIKIKSQDIKTISYIYVNYLQSLDEYLEASKTNAIYVEIDNFLSQVEVPIVIYNAMDELVVHNKAFRDLNILSKNIHSADKDFFSWKNKNFKIIRKTVDGLKAFILLENQGDSLKLHDRELGIITGSIAHELNNPIAGILSGVETVLSFCEELPQDEKDILSEIKVSAEKSKNLISTFLGFYKDQSHEVDSPLTQSFKQSLDFLKTRLVETDLKLKVEFTEEEVVMTHQKSLWTMIGYLFFTNVVNIVLRERLIRRSKMSELIIKVILNESIFSFDIELGLGQKVFHELEQSSFFNYLISKDKKYLKISDEQILFEVTQR